MTDRTTPSPPDLLPDPGPDAFDTLLRKQLQADPEPLDAGFSLRVMAALPPANSLPPALTGWLRIARWAATSTAAAGLAAVFASPTLQADPARALAGACLMGLVVFWSIPSRWSGS